MAEGVEVKTGMRIRGVRLKHVIMLFFGVMFLAPPMTPFGAVILITTYMAAKKDIEKNQPQRIEYNVVNSPVEVEANEDEYEEVEIEKYPDSEVEFNNKDFLKNARKWV